MTPVALDRLRDGRDVAAVLRARSQRAGRLLVVHARRRDDAGDPRIAVVASRRVGNAVTRNRAKRLLREASRLVSWQPGVDVVLVARAACAHRRRDDVAGELQELARTMDLVVVDSGARASDRERAAS